MEVFGPGLRVEIGDVQIWYYNVDLVQILGVSVPYGLCLVKLLRGLGGVGLGMELRLVQGYFASGLPPQPGTVFLPR